MASSPLPFLLILSLSVLSSSLSFASIVPDDLRLPSTAKFPISQAEQLIRQLNLLPQDAYPESLPEGRDDGKRIVERRFRLPGLQGWKDGASLDELGHHAGYYRLPHSHAAKLFYFFFESRNTKSDPVVIWLTGGQGCSSELALCSSELALFYENGPFTIANNLSLTWNDYGWDKVSNLIYVDQPTGTGFSYSSDGRDINMMRRVSVMICMTSCRHCLLNTPTLHSSLCKQGLPRRQS